MPGCISSGVRVVPGLSHFVLLHFPCQSCARVFTLAHLSCIAGNNGAGKNGTGVKDTDNAPRLRYRDGADERYDGPDNSKTLSGRKLQGGRRSLDGGNVGITNL